MSNKRFIPYSLNVYHYTCKVNLCEVFYVFHKLGKFDTCISMGKGIGPFLCIAHMCLDRIVLSLGYYVHENECRDMLWICLISYNVNTGYDEVWMCMVSLCVYMKILLELVDCILCEKGQVSDAPT